MKAAYEHVGIIAGCSVRIYHRKLSRIPFEWHHHPEYELTLTLNSCGKRYIGDAISDYGDNDLVLVPPDLPHTWSSNRSITRAAQQEAIVIWFEGEWVRRLVSCCPEYEPLLRLLRRAGCGLAFGDGPGERMRQRLPGLLSSSAIVRLRAVLDVLCALAEEDDAVALASPSAFRHPGQGKPSGHQPEHINRILATIDTRFAERLTLEELAAAGNLSVRSLNRYFQRHIGESAGQYLARTRIGHACRLLSDTCLPISVIASRSGYPSVANFNRQFRSLKMSSPSAWRRQFAPHSEGATPFDDGRGGSQIEQRPPSLERRGGSRRKESGAAR
ncbi:helix-turn-helix domain-containing protein [Paludibacterium yongneupense]|uniref:helix-turn-helix domain-containing protein n=1 Tax=Paludibacterium yongneupense TaxID=400061 RepID=UPI000424FCA9|nr:AraC family transcriptional regulator [Paludibacterium yongneupense]